MKKILVALLTAGGVFCVTFGIYKMYMNYLYKEII